MPIRNFYINWVAQSCFRVVVIVRVVVLLNNNVCFLDEVI